MGVQSVTPVLNVSSIRQSFAWFESLGWQRGFSWNQHGMIGFGKEAADADEHGDASFGSVVSGEAAIFLCLDGQGPRGTELPGDGGTDGVWMSWWMESPAEVDALHSTAVAKGMTITHPPTDEPWGAREFHLRHPDGHTFRVSANRESQRHRQKVVRAVNLKSDMKYYGTALLLGLGWFGVLLVPVSVRAWILGGPASWPWNLAALVATSLVTARIFRPWIVSAASVRENLWRALVIPWVACAIYLTLYNGYSAASDFIHTGRVNLHDSVLLYYWGLLYALLSVYVVLPYSYLCQWMLNRTSRLL